MSDLGIRDRHRQKHLDKAALKLSSRTFNSLITKSITLAKSEASWRAMEIYFVLL